MNDTVHVHCIHSALSSEKHESLLTVEIITLEPIGILLFILDGHFDDFTIGIPDFGGRVFNYTSDDFGVLFR